MVTSDPFVHSFSRGALAASQVAVEAAFHRHLPGAHAGVRFLPGFFASSLPGPVRRLALLRIDADLYSSIFEGLDSLYPLLSVGGYVVIDDWKFAQARAAVMDYRAQQNITSPMRSSNRNDVSLRVFNHPYYTLDRIAFWRKSAL